MYSILFLTVLLCSNFVQALESEPVRDTNQGIVWRDCGNDDSTITFRGVTVHPPPPIKLGTEMTLRSDVLVNRTVQQGTRSELKVRRIVKDLCNMFEGSELQCFLPSGQSVACKCPMPPGEYHVKDFKYKLPLGILARFFLTGEYRFTWRWVDKDGHMLGCVEGDVAIAKD